jgi:hypothetical protein
MARAVDGAFFMINVTIMRDAILRGAVTFRLVVGIGQAVDRSRSRNEGNRDWRSDKASQSERGKECPDTGNDAFGQPIQHFLAIRRQLSCSSWRLSAGGSHGQMKGS